MTDLTIYIPTYSRPRELQRLLDSIEFLPDVRVHVSDDSGSAAFQSLCSCYPVHYEAMRYRQGRDVNVLRGAAVCETEWLWVVGDDDWLLPHAVGAVLEACRRDDADRIVLHSPATVDRVPNTIKGKSAPAAEIIDTLRSDPALLIATTLCSSNVYRTSVMSTAEGLRHSDTFYAYAWASIYAQRWHIMDRPTIRVGIEHANTVPDITNRLQDYLDATCDAVGAARLPFDAYGWNFVSAESQWVAQGRLR